MHTYNQYKFKSCLCLRVFPKKHLILILLAKREAATFPPLTKCKHLIYQIHEKHKTTDSAKPWATEIAERIQLDTVHDLAMSTELLNILSLSLMVIGCHPLWWCIIHFLTVIIISRILSTSPNTTSRRHDFFRVTDASNLVKKKRSIHQ